jgi:hypothetical protein
MNKGSGRFHLASPAPSELLIFGTIIHLSIGVVTHISYLLRGSSALFRYYFAYEDPLFLVFCTVLELSWASLAWKQFSPGQLLRRAWLLIMISAVCHVVGMSISHLLCMDSYINPLYVFKDSWYNSASVVLLPVGTFIGGPLHMFALAGGLFLALRLCQQFGIHGKLKGLDWVVLGIVVAYTMRVAYVLVRLRIKSPQPLHLGEAVTWLNDPLLCVLLFLAFFLRRRVVQMGPSYVAECWGAYVVAILGTSMASMATWAADFGFLPYPERAVLWYIWPVIYAAYALGPIYQVEASRVARARLKSFSSPF